VKLLKDYIQRYGSMSEVKRFAANALPEAELDAVVYSGIWETLLRVGGTFYKRKRLSHEEVEQAVRDVAIMHRKALPGDKVTFEVIEPADEFNAEEWDTLRRLKRAVTSLSAEDVEVMPYWVLGHCGRKTLRTAYARVELTVEGRPYKVEVCLK